MPKVLSINVADNSQGQSSVFPNLIKSLPEAGIEYDSSVLANLISGIPQNIFPLHADHEK